MLRTAKLLLVIVVFGLAGSLARAEDLRQIIDRQIQAGWEKEKIKPAGRADDATFLRRVTLDLVGTVPTYQEIEQFLADNDPQKRQKLVDKLLDDPRFARQQADVWDLVFFGRNPSSDLRKRDAFKKWLTEQFANNTPYDHWARELLLADQPGTEAYYVQYRNQPEEATVGVTRTFLGTQLQCARCHDHPFENWTQKDFYGMAGFFVRIVVMDMGGPADNKKFMVGEKSTGDVLFTGSVKDQKPGQKGEPVKPRFLGGDELDEPVVAKDFKEPDFKGTQKPPKPQFSRKEKLAQWVTAFDNPYFAKAVTNRVWAQFLGRGIVHPVDDLNGRGDPSYPDLLDMLAKEMAEHKFDLKWLIRELVNSETYQLAGGGPNKDATPKWYDRARVRPLSAEEMQAAIRTATGMAADDKFGGATNEYFLRYFGEPLNGQGEFQGSLQEHLFLNNAGELRQVMARKKGNLADQVLSSADPWEKKVDRLFLSVLGRLPRAEEQKRFVAFLTSDPKSDALVTDAIWVLFNTAEFRFNH